MLYYLLTGLTDDLSLFNVFRYQTVRTGSAILTALVFIWLFGPAIISLLKLKQGRGQPIRSDGPQRHLLEKQGTPTMGGLMILSGILVSTLLWADLANLYVWAVLFVTLGFGAIGFYDDFLKVTKSSHHGFSGLIRLALECVIAAIAVAIFKGIGDAKLSSALAVPFFKDVLIQLGFFFVVFGAIVVVVKHEIVLAIVGGLFVLETASVIVQVASFKMTGKRVFAMAPLHHHFEQKGWKEPTIVIRFWIIAFVLALIGLSTLKLR